MNRQVIFEEEVDYHRWLDTMASCKEKSKFELYAWCLMGNHIHLMIKEAEEPLSLIIKRIGSSFCFGTTKSMIVWAICSKTAIKASQWKKMPISWLPCVTSTKTH